MSPPRKQTGKVVELFSDGGLAAQNGFLQYVETKQGAGIREVSSGFRRVRPMTNFVHMIHDLSRSLHDVMMHLPLITAIGTLTTGNGKVIEADKGEVYQVVQDRRDSSSVSKSVVIALIVWTLQTAIIGAVVLYAAQKVSEERIAAVQKQVDSISTNVLALEKIQSARNEAIQDLLVNLRITLGRLDERVSTNNDLLHKFGMSLQEHRNRK